MDVTICNLHMLTFQLFGKWLLIDHCSKNQMINFDDFFCSLLTGQPPAGTCGELSLPSAAVSHSELSDLFML